MNLTIVYITNRDEPRLDWFTASLMLQTHSQPIILVVSPHNRHGVFPKPTVWSGPSRLTKQDWWSASNARNTGICLCQTDWIAFVDDRCVLMPGWLDCIRAAMSRPFPYVLCGTYEKRINMTVENGVIINPGTIIGRDSRAEYCETHYVKPHGMKPPFKAPGEWTYGCSIALPLEWALNIGGFEEEHCDGLSGEDYVFGKMLENNGYPVMFEPRMKMVEDRTEGQCGPIAIRRDKGVSPNDKSHAALDKLKGLKHTLNRFDIRKVRADVLAGKPWPPPSGSDKDWFDGQPLSEMTPT